MIRFHQFFPKILSIGLSLTVGCTALSGCSSTHPSEADKPLIGISWRADTDSEFLSMLSLPSGKLEVFLYCYRKSCIRIWSMTGTMFC